MSLKQMVPVYLYQWFAPNISTGNLHHGTSKYYVTRRQFEEVETKKDGVRYEIIAESEIIVQSNDQNHWDGERYYPDGINK